MAQRKPRRAGTPARKPQKPSRKKKPRSRAGQAAPFDGPKGSLGGYAAHHARDCLASLGRLVSQTLSTLMTVAVIGIALALPAGLQLLVANGQALGSNWDGAIEIAVYLQRDVSKDQAAALADELAADPAIDGVQLIPADDALEEFRQYSGFGSALDALEENPLPSVIVVRPAEAKDSAADVGQLSKRLREELPADIVQADTEWVGRFHAMLDVVRRVVVLAGLMLAVGVIIIVGNTIRLDIQNRRDEIEVAKLIGATDGFIRRPFLYTGFWYGLLGGLLALSLIALLILALDEPVRRLAGLYGSGFRLTGPGAVGGFSLVLGGALLGWLGSGVSATRSMRRIEPGN